MRIELIFSKIVSECNHERIAIIAHGGVINCILRSFFKMPVNKDLYFKIGDTTIHLLEITKKNTIIHFLNNTSYLD